jgi:hypothetical protein
MAEEAVAYKKEQVLIQVHAAYSEYPLVTSRAKLTQLVCHFHWLRQVPNRMSATEYEERCAQAGKNLLDEENSGVVMTAMMLALVYQGSRHNLDGCLSMLRSLLFGTPQNIQI